MLISFRKKLMVLADDPRDDFRKRMIQQVGPVEAVRFEAPLRKMILAMPDMLAQLSLWSRELGMPQPLRRAQMLALAYIYSPDDLLPDESNGLYGYLDDAYVVASTYSRTLQEVGPAGLRPMTDNVPLALLVPDWVRLTRECLPEMTERADALLDAHLGYPDGRWKNAAPLPGRGPSPKSKIKKRAPRSPKAKSAR